MNDTKPTVYTAIPKYLVYGNLEIGTFVENHGYAVNTPWQYAYGMAGKVDYDDLKESLNTYAQVSDEVWVFAEDSGFIPSLEVEEHFDLGITDGCLREIRLAEDVDNPVHYYHFDAESMEITARDPPQVFPPSRSPKRQVLDVVQSNKDPVTTNEIKGVTGFDLPVVFSTINSLVEEGTVRCVDRGWEEA